MCVCVCVCVWLPGCVPVSLGLGYVGSRIRGERKSRLSLCDEEVPLNGLVWTLTGCAGAGMCGYGAFPFHPRAHLSGTEGRAQSPEDQSNQGEASSLGSVGEAHVPSQTPAGAPIGLDTGIRRVWMLAGETLIRVPSRSQCPCRAGS